MKYQIIFCQVIKFSRLHNSFPLKLITLVINSIIDLKWTHQQLHLHCLFFQLDSNFSKYL